MDPQQPAQQSQQPAAAPQQAAPEPQAAPSGLEKVYADFNIEDTAASFQPQSQPATATQAAPQAAPQQQAFKVPDPFDPGFGEYQQRVASTVSSLSQALSETQGKITAFERNLQVRQTEADIKQAVGLITEKAGIDPDIAEVALEAKARKDPRFLKVWNDRARNPKAFQAAIAAVASEFAQKYTVRQDPQLVENQRAAAASRQHMATTAKEDANAEWAGMTASERQAKVRMLINSGGR